MEYLTFAHVPVVMAALDAALKAALGSKVSGISLGAHGDDVVTVWMPDQLTLGEQAQIESIVLAHNPAILAAERAGEDITLDVWLPHQTEAVAAVQLLVEGVSLPAQTDVSADAERGGYSGQQAIQSAAAITITVQDYPGEVTV